MTKTELLNKTAQSEEERLLLARALDQLELARTRNIPAHTGFLSPQERAAIEAMLNAAGHPRHVFLGGFPGAERTICAFLPDWQEEADLLEDQPIRALRAVYSGGGLTHRDFLGAILGLGLDREKVGDLLVGEGQCDILVLEEILDFLVLHLDQAGRSRLKVSPIPLSRLEPPRLQVKTIRVLSAAGRGGGVGVLPVPGESGGPDRLRALPAQPPGVRQARPAGGGGRRAHVPGTGEMCGQGSGRSL